MSTGLGEVANCTGAAARIRGETLPPAALRAPAARAGGAGSSSEAGSAAERGQLTTGQKDFARHFVDLDNARLAYDVAFPSCGRTQRKSAEYARRLLRLPKVRARIAELRGGQECPPAAPPLPAGGETPRAPTSPRVDVPEAVLEPPEGREAISAEPVADDADVVAEIEDAAAIAFDDTAPDVVRLVAVRAVTRGLRRLRRQRSETIVVTISIGVGLP